MSMNSAIAEKERLRRWRLILGGGAADGIGCGGVGEGDGTGGNGLSAADRAIDAALDALYNSDRSGGLGQSTPKVARWLGDIRTYFPSSVVRVMQQDALERLNLQQMLLEPEMLAAIEPDIHMVANLVSLSQVMPSQTKETARIVVRRVVEELQRQLEQPMRQAVMGSLNRSRRNRRPRHSEIDWHRTIARI